MQMNMKNELYTKDTNYNNELAPELTREQIKNARPASEVLPSELYAALVANQQARKAARGVQVAPKLKAITLRLDEATLNAFKATGKGWQGRMRAILQKAVKP